jgi:hypothetical protein
MKLAILVLITITAQAQSFSITSPTSSQVITASQPLQLTASVSGYATAYKTSYYIDYSQRWVTAYVQNPALTLTDYRDGWQGAWNATWYTGLNGDGTHTVSAYLYDIKNTLLATATPVSFVINSAGMQNQTITYLPNYPFQNAVGGGINSATTNTINGSLTASPTLAVLGVTWYNAGSSCASPPSPITDSSSNTYTQAVASGNDLVCAAIYYTRNPTVSSSFDWTATGSSHYTDLVGVLLTGTAMLGGADVTGSNHTASTVGSLAANSGGTITPNHNNENCFAVFGNAGNPGNPSPGVSVSSPFVLQNYNGYNSGQWVGDFLSYDVQTTAAGVNPTFTFQSNISGGVASAIACFQ